MTVSRVHLSSKGPEVSRLAQGWASAVRRGLTVPEATAHVHACLELGITTMDNAAIYGGGAAETLLGAALAAEPGLRERVEIITKCSVGTWGTSLYHYDTSRAHILSSVEHSLQELRTDRIDLLLIHRPDPLMDADEVAEAFASRFGPEVVVPDPGAPARGGADSGAGLRVDLWAATTKAARELGIRADQVVNPRLCTACNPKWFYSYRKEGPVTGRQGCVAWTAGA